MSHPGGAFLFTLLIVGVIIPHCFSQNDGSSATADGADPSMEIEEANAVFTVLQAVNFEIDWRSLFPGDNPCTGGPHGLNCELSNDGNTLHVVELNLGWVSDYVNNPPCSNNATIHSSILKFKRLRKLFFYQCFMREPMIIPPEISLMTSLQHLTFQNNIALVGNIPASFSNLVSLERLVLSENMLSGPVPAELGELINLKQLVLSHNLFNGTIPESMSNLQKLLILDLSGNSLGGHLPSFLSSLQRLVKVDVSANLFCGEVPAALPGNVKFLDFSYNNLSGGIPDSLMGLSNLQYLFIRGNPVLSGNLTFVGNLTSLEMLALSSSGLTGAIPESIGRLRKLNSLALDGNLLSGIIPSSIASLESLYHLNLSSNQLSGPLPFPKSFMSRLGKNMALRNNTGLCSSTSISEKHVGDSELYSLGVSQCDPSSKTLFKAFAPQYLGSSFAARGTSSVNRYMMLLIIASVFFWW